VSSSPILYTYHDAIEDLLDWLGVAVDANALRMAKRAILAAYRDIPNARGWAYYMNRARITTVAPYDTGTIAYTHSSRTVTLTDGTWPTWAANGVLTIDNVQYQVTTRTSSSALVLSTNTNPGDDVASGTSYTLAREEYTIPVDMLSAGQLIDLASQSWVDFVEPQDWLLGHSQPAELLHGEAGPSALRNAGDRVQPGARCGLQLRLHLPSPPPAIEAGWLHHGHSLHVRTNRDGE
jgi:hypothetical protein